MLVVCTTTFVPEIISRRQNYNFFLRTANLLNIIENLYHHLHHHPHHHSHHNHHQDHRMVKFKRNSIQGGGKCNKLTGVLNFFQLLLLYKY